MRLNFIRQILSLGHKTTDSDSDKKIKSIFSLVMIGLIFVCFVFYLGDRTLLERLTDTWLFLMCLITLFCLFYTKSKEITYYCLSAMAIPGEIVLLLLNGNRDGDLNYLFILAICSIPMLGPRKSIPIFIVTAISALFVVIVDPYLPYLSSVSHISESNPSGLIFHSPSKKSIGFLEATGFLVSLTLIYMMTYATFNSLNNARERIEDLLLNILPPSIIERLTAKKIEVELIDSATIADNFDEVTILFADIVGFTKHASTKSASDLVNMLNHFFTEFDKISEKYRVEKIKTIGDAYMAVCGLPDPDPRHAQNVANMALEMIQTVKTMRFETSIPFRIRIGINTGPVVAGIIGRKKFIYDLWGDAVNTASRMESHGEPGTIQVSKTTYEILKTEYEFESIGKLEMKGIGMTDAYRLLRRNNY